MRQLEPRREGGSTPLEHVAFEAMFDTCIVWLK